MAITVVLMLMTFMHQGTTIWIGRQSNYVDYHIENKCSSDESITYVLEKKGLKSAAKIWASPSLRNSGERSCMITVEVQPFCRKYGVVISVKSLNFQSNKSECSGYIKLYLDGGRTKTVCKAAEEGESYATSGKLKIEYKTSHHARLKYQTDFLLIVTAYKRRGWFWCGFGRFQCDNRRCIWPGLTCDGYDNCGDSSDEFDFGRSHCYQVRQYNCKRWKETYNLDCDEMVRATERPLPIIDLADETTRLREITTQTVEIIPSSEILENDSTAEIYMSTSVTEDLSEQDITLNDTHPNSRTSVDQMTTLPPLMTNLEDSLQSSEENTSVKSNESLRRRYPGGISGFFDETTEESFSLGVHLQRMEEESRTESETAKRAYIHILTIVGSVIVGMAAVGAVTCCFVWYRVSNNKKKFASAESRPLAVTYVKSPYLPPPEYEM